MRSLPTILRKVASEKVVATESIEEEEVVDEGFGQGVVEDGVASVTLTSGRAKRKWAKVRMAALSIIDSTRHQKLIKGLEEQARKDIEELVARNSESIKEQGDVSMYTKENILARRALKFDARVQAATQQLWALCRGEPDCVEVPIPHTEEMTKEQYVRLNRRFHLLLVEDVDEADLDGCAEDDWEADSKGNDKLSYPLFRDAMFELADIWCEGIDAEEYATFLAAVLQALSMDGAFKMKDEKDIRFMSKAQLLRAAARILSRSRKAAFFQKFGAGTSEEDRVTGGGGHGGDGTGAKSHSKNGSSGRRGSSDGGPSSGSRGRRGSDSRGRDRHARVGAGGPPQLQRTPSSRRVEVVVVDANAAAPVSARAHTQRERDVTPEEVGGLMIEGGTILDAPPERLVKLRRARYDEGDDMDPDITPVPRDLGSLLVSKSPETLQAVRTAGRIPDLLGGATHHDGLSPSHAVLVNDVLRQVEGTKVVQGSGLQGTRRRSSTRKPLVLSPVIRAPPIRRNYSDSSDSKRRSSVGSKPLSAAEGPRVSRSVSDAGGAPVDTYHYDKRPMSGSSSRSGTGSRKHSGARPFSDTNADGSGSTRPDSSPTARRGSSPTRRGSSPTTRRGSSPTRRGSRLDPEHGPISEYSAGDPANVTFSVEAAGEGDASSPDASGRGHVMYALRGSSFRIRGENAIRDRPTKSPAQLAAEYRRMSLEAASFSRDGTPRTPHSPDVKHSHGHHRRESRDTNAYLQHSSEDTGGHGEARMNGQVDSREGGMRRVSYAGLASKDPDSHDDSKDELGWTIGMSGGGYSPSFVHGSHMRVAKNIGDRNASGSVVRQAIAMDMGPWGSMGVKSASTPTLSVAYPGIGMSSESLWAGLDATSVHSPTRRRQPSSPTTGLKPRGPGGIDILSGKGITGLPQRKSARRLVSSPSTRTLLGQKSSGVSLPSPSRKSWQDRRRPTTDTPTSPIKRPGSKSPPSRKGFKMSTVRIFDKSPTPNATTLRTQAQITSRRVSSSGMRIMKRADRSPTAGTFMPFAVRT